MADQQRRWFMVMLRSAGELLLVAAIVFGLGWAGTRLAQALHSRPLHPDAVGAIHLAMRDADWQGDTTCVEVGSYDAALRCRGSWLVQWLVAIEEFGRYDINVSLACTDPRPNDELIVTIAEHTLRGRVPQTESWTRWKKPALGFVDLEPGIYRLAIRPASPSEQRDIVVKSATITRNTPSTSTAER